MASMAYKRKAGAAPFGSANGKRRAFNGTKPTRTGSRAPQSRARRPAAASFQDDASDDDHDHEAGSDAFLVHDSDDDARRPAATADADAGDAEAAETADEARVRLTRAYLDSIRTSTAGDDSAESDADAELDAEASLLDARLMRDVEDQRGTRISRIAERFAAQSFWSSVPSPSLHRLHRLSATCVTLSSDDRFAYSGSKDGSVVEFDVEQKKKVTLWKSPSSARDGDLRGNGSGVASIARSSDARFLAIGGVDGQIQIFDSRVSSTSRHSLVQSFSAHKTCVSGLAFRLHSPTLFSCSHDRTVKVWDASQSQPYVETLFGHMSAVNAIDAGHKLVCVTAAADKTARLWKVETESQLLFRAERFATSLDAIAMTSDASFIAGGEDGSVHHWTATKKKPTDLIPLAHAGTWITAVAALRQTDLAVTGGSDGFLNLYQITTTNKLRQLHRIPLLGFVNGLACAASARFLVAGMGQEHRAGRWLEPIRHAKNGLAIVPLIQDRE